MKLKKFITLLALISSILYAGSSSWAPILMGETTTFVPYGQTNALKTLKNVYKPNELISVKVDAALSGDEDWVGVYHKGAESNWANVVSWNWIPHNGTTVLSDKEKDMPVGAYEVRLFFHNNYDLKASYPFVVSTDTFKTIKTKYNVNETVTVMVNRPLSGNKDWVGIYPKNADNSWGNVIAWNWVPNKGNIELTKDKKPMPKGNYEVRLFFNNSYDMEATYSFSVGLGDNKYPQTTTLKYRKTDNNVRKPTVGNPTIDPVYNTKISMLHKSDTRIANYPKVQSWNKDMTLIRIKNRIYDANTLNETKITNIFDKDHEGGAFSTICSPNSADFRWSNKDPDKFYVLNKSRKFIGGKIIGDTTNCDTVLLDLSKYETVEFGPYSEGNIDNNDRYVIFVAKKYNDTNIYMILFDIQNKRVVWRDKKVDDDRWINPKGYWETNKLDWVSVSQSGKYIVMNKYKHGLYRFDINLNNKVTLQYKDQNGKFISRGEHGDFGFDSNGNEVYVQYVFEIGQDNGVYMFNLEKPHELPKRILSGTHGGGHVSCRNVDRPGWCYVTTQEEGYRDVFALKLDASHPNTVEYFSQTHMKEDFKDKNGNIDIYLETYGSPSPDGTKMIFNSHWDTNRIDTFVVEAQ